MVSTAVTFFNDGSSISSSAVKQSIEINHVKAGLPPFILFNKLRIDAIFVKEIQNARGIDVLAQACEI